MMFSFGQKRSGRTAPLKGNTPPAPRPARTKPAFNHGQFKFHVKRRK